MAKEKSKRGNISRRDMSAPVITLIVTITYFVIGWLLPDYTYDYGTKVIYPVFVFYKSFPNINALLVGLLLMVNIILVLRNLHHNMRHAIVASIMSLVLGCSLVFSFVGFDIVSSSSYRHHDSITFGNHTYKIGLSLRKYATCCDIPDYALFKCDLFGVICEYTTSYGNPDISLNTDYRAYFHQPENDGWIYLYFGKRRTMPMFCNESPGRQCSSVE